MMFSPYSAMIVLSQVMMIIPQNDAVMSCKKTNASKVDIHLSCRSNHWIHVRSETYGNTTLENGCLDTTNSCTNTRRKDAEGLIVNCNGKQSCHEIVEATSTCIPVRGYKVIYDCVKVVQLQYIPGMRNCESLNVCSAENKSMIGSVYLHSPGFPDSDGVNDNCTCSMTGQLMSIQLIEHRQRKKDLNIATDGDNLDQGIAPVNRIIAQRANHTTLNYQGMEDGRFWIKVAGYGMIHVECSNDMLSTSMVTTTLDTTTESSTTGMVTVTFTNETSTTSSATTSSGATTTGNSAESSDTESSTITMISTTKEETAKEFRAGPLSIVALASIGAAGGFVLLVLIVVGVICCRRLKMSKVEKRRIITDHNYFQLDPDFVSLDRKEADEEASTPREECHNMSQYAKVLGRPRGPAYDNNTLNDGDHGMITNGICVSRPPNKEQPQEGMVDNFLYHTFRHSDTTSEATNQSPVMDHGTGDKDKGMVIDDLNHCDQTPFVDQHVKTIAQESHQIDPRCSNDGEGTTDRDAVDGMMINDLYHSYQASSGTEQGGGDILAVPAQTEQPEKNKKQDEEEDTARMVINDLYHSYQSPQKSQNLNKDQEHKDGAEESHDNNLMVENDLYYQERKPRQDDAAQRISAGHYEEIVNNELPDPGDVKDQGPKPRPPAYEDIADITSIR